MAGGDRAGHAGLGLSESDADGRRHSGGAAAGDFALAVRRATDPARVLSHAMAASGGSDLLCRSGG